MGRAATVYAEELFTYGYGHPLWCPEPSKGLDGSTRDVQLGDVGYVDEDGGFRRLFNVTVDAGHKLNAGGVPKGFSPVDLNESLIPVRNKFLHPLPICSESVEGRTVRAQVAANASGVAVGEVSYAFRCASHRGAFLFLKDHATKSSIDPNPQLEQYMLQHHESWYAFATDPKKLGIRCDRERIVLVRGTIKTSAWSIGAFLGKVDRAYEVTVGAHLGPNGSANLQLSSEFTHYNNCVQRSGPDRTSQQATPILAHSSVPHAGLIEADSTTTDGSCCPELLLDQCVFVSYYKIKSRLLFPKKIVANAKPSSEDGDFGTHDDTSSALFTVEADIEPETAHIEPRSPLDEILDYILQHSDATVAIASDADIEWLFPGNEIPSALADTLRDLAPQINVDETKAGQLDTYRGLSQRLPISQSVVAEQSSLPSLLAYSLVPRGIRGKLSTLSDSMASEFQSEWENTHTSESPSLRTLSTVSSPTPIPKIVDAMWSNTSPSGDTVIITPKPHISSPGPSSETMEDIESMGSLSHYSNTSNSVMPQFNLYSSGVPTALFDLPAQDFTSPQSTVLELASRFPCDRQIVPQLPYRPTTQSDRRRYIEGVVLKHPVMFYNRTCTSCGISLGDALRGLTNDMYGREDLMFENGGPSIAVRLMWPGYAPWSRQIPTRDFHSPPRPITREKLAKNIAKTVIRFIEDKDGKPMDEGADARYKVGRHHIGVEDLELLGLQHVSMGSWQAHLRLRRGV